MLYTTVGLSEVEVLRLADAIIDLPLPGKSLRPFQRTTEAIRALYHRLPPWTLTQRVGEFVDAWQLPELSLGDASATYSVATGGVAGPGSGMVVRIHKLIDWTQHVVEDLNRVVGRAIGRPGGLVRWSLPGRTVDGAQWVLIKSFTSMSVLLDRAVDGSLTIIELAGDEIINAGHQRAQQAQAVVLRLPPEVYRAHELWMLEHRRSLVFGTAEEFARSTHAALAHHRRQVSLSEWSAVDRPDGEEAVVIVMTNVRVMSRAPETLKPYVVPAAWLLATE
jgi:hypothetical protein